MKQREVTDSNNIRWTCVQAYAGTDGKVAKEIEEKSESDDGQVPVICTPSGGAQSVRISLKKNWEELQDDELLMAIEGSSED